MQTDVDTPEPTTTPYRVPGAEIPAEAPAPEQGEQIVRLAAGLLLLVQFFWSLPSQLDLTLSIEMGGWFRVLWLCANFLGQNAVCAVLAWFLIRGSTGARWVAVVQCSYRALLSVLQLDHLAHSYGIDDPSMAPVIIARALAQPLLYLVVVLLLWLPAPVGAFFAAKRLV